MLAKAVKFQQMTADLHIQTTFEFVLQRAEATIFEFQDAVAIGANHMMMMAAGHHHVGRRHAGADIGRAHDAQFGEQIKGTENARPPHRIIDLCDLVEQIRRGHMSVEFLQGPQDAQAGLRHFVTSTAQATLVLFHEFKRFGHNGSARSLHLGYYRRNTVIRQVTITLIHWNHPLGAFRMQLRIIPVLAILFFSGVTIRAQTESPDQPSPLQPNIHDPVTILEANRILQEAQSAVDLAFDLLGIFEALSLAVTVGGVTLGVVGLRRFNNAQEELAKTRQEVIEEFQAYRERFERQIEEREAELKVLRQELEQSSQKQREDTSNALLAQALLPLGERQYKFSDIKGALNTYNRALELDPLNPIVNQRLGYVYTQSGELDKAKHHYEQVIEREKDFPQALAGLGFVYRRLGDAVDKELQALPKDDEERTKMQIERDRHYNQAENLLLRALDLSPSLIDDDGESWWGVMGGLYKRRDQIDQAIDAYSKATKVTPESSYGLSNLALLYMKKNDRERMFATYERVERIARREAESEQGNFWGYADYIVSSYAIGKDKQARDALTTAIEIAPDSPYMLEGLVGTLEDLREALEERSVPPIDEAIEILKTEMANRQRAAAS